MQLSFDAADRLVELVQVRRGPVSATEAARVLFALTSAPQAIARSLLEDVVSGDVRLSWRGAEVGLASPPGIETPLEAARFVVVDLETTGLTPTSARICEIGAQRVVGLELGETFETLVDPGVPLPPFVAALTGISAPALRGAPRPEHAVRQFLSFAGDAALVAHNARFDLAFLDSEVERFAGQRIAAPVIDTVWLARRLLGDRTRRVGLAALAQFFGVATEPCHRALPDARATAEILVRLIGLAQERGARTVAELVELAAPRARRLHAKRVLAAGAPTRPGVYTFADVNGTTLYVGRARDLRRRLRSYFEGGRQRPAVEAALGALARIDWTETGSELEAALEELRLLRTVRPPANVRGTRPDRHLYLRRRASSWAVTEQPTSFGPLRSRRVARAAAQALDGCGAETPQLAVPALRRRLASLAAAQRYEDAARLRDRIAQLDVAVRSLEELARLRALDTCVLVPHTDPRFLQAYAVTGGRIAATRALPTGCSAGEASALVAEARRGGASCAPEDADELSVLGGFLRRPPPELRQARLETQAIVRVLAAPTVRLAFVA